MAIYFWYFRMMKWPLVFFMLLAMLVQSGLSIGTNFWLSAWSNVGLNNTNASHPEVRKLDSFLGCQMVVYITNSISKEVGEYEKYTRGLFGNYLKNLH